MYILEEYFQRPYIVMLTLKHYWSLNYYSNFISYYITSLDKPKRLILKQGLFCTHPSGDIWHCLETFLIIMTGRDGVSDI